VNLHHIEKDAATWVKNNGGASAELIISILQANHPAVDASEIDRIVRQAKIEFENKPVETTDKKLARLEIENLKLQAKLEESEEDYDLLVKESMARTDELLLAKKQLGEPGKSASKPTNKIFTMPADLIESKKINWLWPHKIPMNKLSVFAGNPDQGKSLATLYVIAQLTRGLPMYGETAAFPKSDVLIMAAED
jgi:AAA domain